MTAMFGYLYISPMYWLFILPGFLLGLYAQFRLSATYNKYLRVGLTSGMSGAEAARTILDRAGLDAMPVEVVPGERLL